MCVNYVDNVQAWVFSQTCHCEPEGRGNLVLEDIMQWQWIASSPAGSSQ
jgi:hypothetical protein